MLSLIQQIDAQLPQTQCGLCGHRDGCLPYAKAIAEGEAANKCVPGGQPVADALAQLLDRPTLVAQPSQWQTMSDGRPQRIKAVIREDECIGCTKCISACPVDAIIGTGKMMHTILTDLCTGCELCVPPCPVDCIDLIEDPYVPTAQEQQQQQDDLRTRYYAHITREAERTRKGPIVKAQIDTTLFADFVPSLIPKQTIKTTILDAKTTIEQARLRTQIKKLEKQLSVREDIKKREQLNALQQQLGEQ